MTNQPAGIDPESLDRIPIQQKSIRLLLIDDEPIEYKLLCMKLGVVEDMIVHVDFAMTIEAAVLRVANMHYDVIFLDNRLLPNNDFRETAPFLRGAGYIGPVGIVSSDISGDYFQQFDEYGIDFRIGKDEIDLTSLRYILTEYTRDNTPDGCEEAFS